MTWITCFKLGNFSQMSPVKYPRTTLIIQLKIHVNLDSFMEVGIYIVSQACIP